MELKVLAYFVLNIIMLLWKRDIIALIMDINSTNVLEIIKDIYSLVHQALNALAVLIPSAH